MEGLPPSPSAPPPPGLVRVRSARWLAVLSTLIVLVLYGTVGFAVQSLNIPFGLWFTEVFVFLAVGWVMLRRTGRPPVAYTRLEPRGWGLLAFGFALGLANFFAFVVPIQYAAQALAPESWKVMDVSQIFRGQTSLELGLIIGAVSIAAPVCEEFFFRGVLQQGLMPPAFSPQRAVLVTAVVFSAFHMDPVGFLARVELGMLFGLLLLRTGSLWPGIAAHSANNLISTLLFFVAERVGGAEKAQAQAQAASPLMQVLAPIVMVLLGMACFFALLLAARRHPSFWRPGSPERVAAEALPAPSLARLVAPWVLAATAAVGGLVLVDSRGLQLQQVDLRIPLRPLGDDAPDAAQAERTALQELRARVRRGEAPLSEYRTERARLRERERGAALH